MEEDVADYHRPRSKRGPRSNGGTAWPRDDRNHALVVTRGHPFDRSGFLGVFEDNEDIEWSHVEHPAAQLLFSPDAASNFDCYVLYDMPGIEFRPADVPLFFEPPEFYVEGLEAMLAAGQPLVILHHACAAWPAWPRWSEIVGSHFLYQPGQSRGAAMPDSGYALDVTHTVTPVANHPITAGIEPFTLVDELYLAPIFEDSITPLFVSDYEFVDTNFSSADLAVRGQLNTRGDWTHPPGSNVVGWIKAAKASPIVYLQFGDGPSAYQDPNYRRILANAITWACSPAARTWALERQQTN